MKRGRFRLLARVEAESLLARLGLKIGPWNGVTATGHSAVRSLPYSRDVRDTFSLAHALLRWLSPSECDWYLLQFDNSTCPLENEQETFESVMRLEPDVWDIGLHRTVVAENYSASEAQSTVGLLIFLSLVFEWHVHLVASSAIDGRRIGLLDGVAHLFGSEDVVSGFDDDL